MSLIATVASDRYELWNKQHQELERTYNDKWREFSNTDGQFEKVLQRHLNDTSGAAVYEADPRHYAIVIQGADTYTSAARGSNLQMSQMSHTAAASVKPVEPVGSGQSAPLADNVPAVNRKEENSSKIGVSKAQRLLEDYIKEIKAEDRSGKGDGDKDGDKVSEKVLSAIASFSPLLQSGLYSQSLATLNSGSIPLVSANPGQLLNGYSANNVYSSLYNGLNQSSILNGSY